MQNHIRIYFIMFCLVKFVLLCVCPILCVYFAMGHGVLLGLIMVAKGLEKGLVLFLRIS